MALFTGYALGQVAVTDDPNNLPPDSTYIFKVFSSGEEQFRVDKLGGIKLNGQLEVDSLQVNGLLTITSDGNSFFFETCSCFLFLS